MASCATQKWGNGYCPQVQLVVNITDDQNSYAILSWYLYYKTSGYPIYDSRNHAYTVTINGSQKASGNYNVNEKAGAEYTIASDTVRINKTSSAQTIPFSLTFKWNTISWNNENSTSDNESASNSITVSAQTTVYRTLTLNKGTGVSSFTSEKTSYANGSTATTRAKPSTGYHISSYSGTTYNGSGTDTWTDVEDLYDDYQTWNMQANRTITAYASKNVVNIYYNANGGFSDSSSYGGLNDYGFIKKTDGTNFYQSMEYNTTGKRDTYNASTFGFKKYGYSFSGYWLLGHRDGITSTQFEQDTDYNPTNFIDYWGSNSNVSTRHNISCYLYAKWIANTYTFNYNANGGTGSMNPSTVTWKGIIDIKQGTFKNPGYKIKGWNVKRERDGKWYCGGNNGWLTYPAEDLKTLYPNGNNVDYEFNGGWTDGLNGDETFTFYAVWEPNNIVRIYDGNQWRKTVPYIYDGEQWRETKPLIYDGTNWKEIKG